MRSSRLQVLAEPFAAPGGAGFRAGGGLRSAAHCSGTREVLTVQQGTVRVTSGAEQRELHAGDSAHYPADVPHVIENIGRGEAVVFLVVYRHD